MRSILHKKRALKLICVLSIFIFKLYMKKNKISQKRFYATRGNQKMKIIGKKYNVDLGIYSNMTIIDYLCKKGYGSLANMLRA